MHWIQPTVVPRPPPSLLSGTPLVGDDDDGGGPKKGFLGGLADVLMQSMGGVHALGTLLTRFF